MAPKKEEKEAKLTPEQSHKMVLDYLTKENRPYSATDVSSNLKNRVTKTNAQKLLKDMHERKEIEGRAAGKQLVYHALQAEPEENFAEKLEEMETDTKRIREETVALKSEEKELRASLKEGNIVVPLPELRAKVAEHQKKKRDAEKRIAKLKGGHVKPVKPEDRARVTKEHKKVKKSADSRKKSCDGVFKDIAGFLEGDKEKIEEVKEELDLQFFSV